MDTAPLPRIQHHAFRTASSACTSAAVALLLTCALGACANSPKLAGTWAPEHATLGGTELPVTAFDGATLKLTDHSYDFKGDVGTYSLVPGTHPPQMDIKGTQGPNAGRTIPAIYELHGDALSICYQLDAAGARPTTFAAPKSTKIFLVEYKRVK